MIEHYLLGVHMIVLKCVKKMQNFLWNDCMLVNVLKCCSDVPTRFTLIHKLLYVITDLLINLLVDLTKKA